MYMYTLGLDSHSSTCLGNSNSKQSFAPCVMIFAILIFFMQFLVIITFFIASGFMSVYHMAVDTVFICACECVHVNTCYEELVWAAPPIDTIAIDTRDIPCNHDYNYANLQLKILSETTVTTNPTS